MTALRFGSYSIRLDQSSGFAHFWPWQVWRTPTHYEYWFGSRWEAGEERLWWRTDSLLSAIGCAFKANFMEAP